MLFLIFWRTECMSENLWNKATATVRARNWPTLNWWFSTDDAIISPYLSLLWNPTRIHTGCFGMLYRKTSREGLANNVLVLTEPFALDRRTRKTNPGSPASSSTVPFAKVHVKVAHSICPLNTVFGSIRSLVTRSSCLETGRTWPAVPSRFNIATLYQAGNQTPQNFQQFNQLEHSVNTILFPHRLLRIQNLDPIRLSIPSGKFLLTTYYINNFIHFEGR